MTAKKTPETTEMDEAATPPAPPSPPAPPPSPAAPEVPANAAVERLEPTAPRPRDDAGHERDEWNLPLAGPPRAVVLGRMGKADPLTDPDDWTDADTKTAGTTPASITPATEESSND